MEVSGIPKSIRVVAGIIRVGSRVLIQKRPAHKHLGGLWEFPGGKVESEERDESALRRELKEELDVEVEIGPLVWQTKHKYGNLEVHLLAYEAKLQKEACMQAKDAQEIRWCALGELTSVRFCPADKELVCLLAHKELQRHPQLK